MINIDTSPERLLVGIIHKDGKSKIQGIYHKLLSDWGGVLSPYDGIYRTSKGFKIVNEAGQRYTWSYAATFRYEKDRLMLTEVDKTCSFDARYKTVKYFYNKPASNVNITDTLNKQCNCDRLWSR